MLWEDRFIAVRERAAASGVCRRMGRWNAFASTGRRGCVVAKSEGTGRAKWVRKNFPRLSGKEAYHVLFQQPRGSAPSDRAHRRGQRVRMIRISVRSPKTRSNIETPSRGPREVGCSTSSNLQ